MPVASVPCRRKSGTYVGGPSQYLREGKAMIRDLKSNRPDEELVRLAAGGDAAAFKEIHMR
jgi:hypothetical protein